MTSRLLTRRALLTGTGALTAAAVYLGADRRPTRTDNNNNNLYKTADEEFHTSSMYPTPASWKGRTFRIRNDYPQPWRATAAGQMPTLPGPDLPVPGGRRDAPWLDYDFKKEPELYCRVVREYCLAGNVDTDFVVQENRVRDWYHAPWMHYSDNGREPVSGLTNELSTPAGVLAKRQTRMIQNWAIGFYNRAGASVFGRIWADPANPAWNSDVKFPEETAVFKLLFTEATTKELSILTGAPTKHAVIAISPKKPKDRRDKASELNLLQMDFAVRDNRADTGWIFGTFIYDGTRQHLRNPWDRLIPVGLMWGNSPQLTQKKYEAGELPTEQWMNKEASDLLASMGGSKAFPGWNKRMNGPVDNFISACSSCHAVSEKKGKAQMTQPKENLNGLVPKDDSKTMQWFRNIRSGESWTPGAISGDYSLQLMQGFHNYHAWRKSVHPFWSFVGLKYVIFDRDLGVDEKRDMLRGQQYDE